jgi:hypothetical protein
MDECQSIGVMDYKKYIGKKGKGKKHEDRCYYVDEDKKSMVINNKIKLTLTKDKVKETKLFVFYENQIIFYKKANSKNWYSHFLYPTLDEYKVIYETLNPTHKIRDLSLHEIVFIKEKTGLSFEYAYECDSELLFAILNRAVEDIVLFPNPRAPIKRLRLREKGTKKQLMRNESERACYESREFLKSKMLAYYLSFTEINLNNFVAKAKQNIDNFESAL